MRAIALVALNASVPASEQHRRDLAQYEHVEVSGEGDSWEAAKEACQIPEDGVVMSWRQGD